MPKLILVVVIVILGNIINVGINHDVIYISFSNDYGQTKSNYPKAGRFFGDE